MTQEKKLLTREDILLVGLTDGEKRLARFCNAVERGDIPDETLLREIAVSFRTILDGAPPKKALDIEKPKGRKPPTWDDQSNRFNIAVMVIQRMESGRTRDDAIEAIAPEIHKSEKTVRRYYDANKDTARALLKLESDMHRAQAPFRALERSINKTGIPAMIKSLSRKYKFLDKN